VPFSADRYEDQWPTYRGDNRRSGATAVPVAESLRQQWSVKLPDVTTPPVIADGKVLLSLKHEQALVALDADSGEQRYRFLPGGRIDSPPSVYGGRIYFGCTDGFLYCLSLEDGSLVWKYQAAPTALNHMFFEKLESTHPLHGTVLVRDGRVHAVCGRSMFLDGGMRYLILDANTGEKIVEHVMDDKVPGSGEPLQMHHEFLNMPMAMPDILSCNDDKIFMRFQEFDLEGKRLELDFPRKLYARDEADKGRSFETMTDQKGEDAHVFSGTGFLDDSWWHRTYWIYGKNYGSGWPGYYLAGKSAPAGRILSYDASGIYGWGRMKQYFKWSKPYRFMLYATDFEYEQTWARAVPILVRAMVKAGDRLHLAGPEELVDQEIVQRSISTEETQALLAEQDAAMQGERGAMLLCVDASDGTVRDGWRLPTTPVFDGVAAVRGRLYVALSDGTVMCLGEEGSALERIGEAEIARFNAEAALPAPQARKPKPKPAKQAT
jgi:outer membrane protein assembly factor BamB